LLDASSPSGFAIHFGFYPICWKGLTTLLGVSNCLLQTVQQTPNARNGPTARRPSRIGVASEFICNIFSHMPPTEQVLSSPAWLMASFQSMAKCSRSLRLLSTGCDPLRAVSMHSQMLHKSISPMVSNVKCITSIWRNAEQILTSLLYPKTSLDYSGTSIAHTSKSGLTIGSCHL
jgi:hypothetical protein